MATYIFFWNPEVSNYKRETFTKYFTHGDPFSNWSINEYESVDYNDRFYMVICGPINAVIARGEIISKAWEGKDWSPKKRKPVFYVDTETRICVNPFKTSTLLTAEEVSKVITGFDWFGGHSGRLLLEEDAKKLDSLFDNYIESNRQLQEEGLMWVDEWEGNDEDNDDYYDDYDDSLDTPRYLELLFPWDDKLCSINPGADPDQDNPFVYNGYWHATVDLEKHSFEDFQKGVWPMYIQAKVRDEGIYILLNEDKKALVSCRGYVPKLPFSDGSGDYIRIKISPDGKIENWVEDFDPAELIAASRPMSSMEYFGTLRFYLESPAPAPTEEELRMLNDATEIMVRAHRNQVDKAGQPYILHPMRIAVKCERPSQKIVALLHDVLEDSDMTPEILRERGFSDYIIDGILAVTRKPGESYDEFIIRCSLHPLGRYVKILDLEDNLNVTRLTELTPSDTARINKYLRAIRFLKSF